MPTEVIVQAAYMTGDMFGVAGALALNPSLRVLVVSDAADQKNVAKMVALYKQSEQGAPQPSINDPAYFTAAALGADPIRLATLQRAQNQPQIVRRAAPVAVRPTRVQTLVVPNSRDFYKSLHDPQRAASRPTSLEQVRQKFAFGSTRDFRIKAMGHSTDIVEQQFQATRNKLDVHKRLTDRWEILDFDELGIQRFLNRKGIDARGKYAFIWIRQSGVNGGAHPNLDSGRAAWTQLIDGLAGGITPVVIGDRFPNMTGLSATGKKVLNLTHFWEEVPFCLYNPTPAVLARIPAAFSRGEGRRAQFVLFSYLRRAGYRVAHIGMRSGVLESVALMGQSVVYMEEINNPQRDRIEDLARTIGTFERLPLTELPIERGQTLLTQLGNLKYNSVGALARAVGENPADTSVRVGGAERNLVHPATYDQYEAQFLALSKPVWAVRYPAVNNWVQYKRNNANWWRGVAAALRVVYDLWVRQCAAAVATPTRQTFNPTDLGTVTTKINTLLA